MCELMCSCVTLGVRLQLLQGGVGELVHLVFEGHPEGLVLRVLLLPAAGATGSETLLEV